LSLELRHFVAFSNACHDPPRCFVATINKLSTLLYSLASSGVKLTPRLKTL